MQHFDFNQLHTLATESQDILKKAVLEEESAKNLLILNHYPYYGAGNANQLYKGILEQAAKKGKNVYFLAGHTHNTDDPNTLPSFQPKNPVRYLIAGAAGGYCSDQCQSGNAGVIFGMVKTDGTLQWERVPKFGTKLPGCHG